MKRSSARAPHVFSAERPKAFVDAVVAIAMTLLILPLMDSVGEANSSGESAFEWILGNQNQLLSFVLSFAIITMFWTIHHRLFERVTGVNDRLLWLLSAWMLSIVWLPVATSLSGQMRSDDATAKTVYIGSMIVTSLLSVAIRSYLARHRELHDIAGRDLRNGVAVDLALATLFALALTISLVLPVVGYHSMLIMFASAPAQLLYRRILGRAAVQRKPHQ